MVIYLRLKQISALITTPYIRISKIHNGIVNDELPWSPRKAQTLPLTNCVEPKSTVLPKKISCLGFQYDSFILTDMPCNKVTEFYLKWKSKFRSASSQHRARKRTRTGHNNNHKITSSKASNFFFCYHPGKELYNISKLIESFHNMQWLLKHQTEVDLQTLLIGLPNKQ